MKGRDFPEWYNKVPLIGLGEDFYLSAYSDLSTCRQVGMGQGPIPWDKIVQYGLFYGLDNENIDFLIKIIGYVDIEFFKRQEDNKPKEPSKIGRKQKNG